MKLHLFRSGQQPDVFGFTGDPTGANLPAAFAPWTQSEQSYLSQGTPEQLVSQDLQSGPIFHAILKDGFYIARSETLSKQTGIPWVG